MKDKDNSTKGFYTHEKFGLVPIGWDVVKLGSSFDFFPTASYSRALLSETGDCGYIHYGDIHTRFDRFIDAVTDTLPCISEDMAKRYTPITDGDLIISDASEDYEGVGKSVEVINVGEKVIISGLHTLHLRVKNNDFIKGFKGYILNQEKVRNSILRIATGIKVYSVSKTELKKIYLPKPPEDEQIQITNILSLIDSAIKATDNSIKAAERVKRSLMQNLLTGKLKPDGTWRTSDEFYKDEKFGNVPVGWDYVKLRDVCTKPGEYGANASAIPFQDGFPRYIRITDIDDFGNLIEEGIVGIELDKAKNYILNEDDFLFARTGDTVGKSLLYKEKMGKAAYAGYLIKFTFNKQLILPEYFNLIAKSDFFEAFKVAMKRVGAKPNINSREYGSFKFIVPENIDEQQVIYNKIKPFEEEKNCKETKIKKLQKLKKSLMQNLLTGKVRIDVEKTNQIFNEIVKAL